MIFMYFIFPTNVCKADICIILSLCKFIKPELQGSEGFTGASWVNQPNGGVELWRKHGSGWIGTPRGRALMTWIEKHPVFLVCVLFLRGVSSVRSNKYTFKQLLTKNAQLLDNYSTCILKSVRRMLININIEQFSNMFLKSIDVHFDCLPFFKIFFCNFNLR